jgi:hypothetical protein
MDFSVITAACCDVFGESCTYTPASAAAYTLTAVFSRGADEGQPDTTGPVVLEAAVSAFTGTPARGDTVTWGARTYRVLDVREEMATASYILSLGEVR